MLFLQSYNLRLGGGVVLKGALLGIVLTGMVAGIDLRSSAAPTVSENVNHHRHSPWSRVARNGRRASAGNAAGALDFHD